MTARRVALLVFCIGVWGRAALGADAAGQVASL